MVRDTSPGDIIIFHHALFHASAYIGIQRHMHDLVYYSYPASETAANHLRDALRARVPPTRASTGWQDDWFSSAWIREAAVDPILRMVVSLIQSTGIFEGVGVDLTEVECALLAEDATLYS